MHAEYIEAMERERERKRVEAEEYLSPFPYTDDELCEMVGSLDVIGSGTYKTVYDLDDRVLKIEDSAWFSSEQAYENVADLGRAGVPHPTVAVHDDPALGAGYDFPVALVQEKAETLWEDVKDGDGWRGFVGGMVAVMETAADREYMLCDNKPENYGVVDGEVQRIDIGDDEVIEATSGSEVAAELEAAYAGIARAASRRSDLAAEEVMDELLDRSELL